MYVIGIGKVIFICILNRFNWFHIQLNLIHKIKLEREKKKKTEIFIIEIYF